jgi:hypothetical protein
MWTLGHLHASIIHDHLLVFDGWELLADFSATIKEKSIDHFHDISLVDHCDLLSSGDKSVLHGVVSHSGSISSGDDFAGLENAWVNLVLDSRVLSFQVISDDDEIDVLVSGLDSWEGVAMSV